MGSELVIPEAAAKLVPTEAGPSLFGWFTAYCRAEVAGAPGPPSMPSGETSNSSSTTSPG
jgi:hypothetical protein